MARIIRGPLDPALEWPAPTAHGNVLDIARDRGIPTTPSTPEVARAWWQNETVIGSMTAYGFALDPVEGLTYDPEREFNPYIAFQENAERLEHLEPYVRAGFFEDVTSLEAFAARAAALEKELENRRIMEAGGWGGFAVGMAVSLFDVLNLIPGVAAARFATNLGRVGAFTAWGAGVGALGETFFQHQQQHRTPFESMLNIGAAAAFVGGLGGLGVALSRRSRLHPEHPENPFHPSAPRENVVAWQPGMKVSEASRTPGAPDTPAAAAAPSGSVGAARAGEAVETGIEFVGTLGRRDEIPADQPFRSRVSGFTPVGRVQQWAVHAARAAAARMMDIGSSITRANLDGRATGPSAEDLKLDRLHLWLGGISEELRGLHSEINKTLGASIKLNQIGDDVSRLKRAVGLGEDPNRLHRYELDDMVAHKVAGTWTPQMRDDLTARFGADRAAKVEQAVDKGARRVKEVLEEAKQEQIRTGELDPSRDLGDEWGLPQLWKASAAINREERLRELLLKHFGKDPENSPGFKEHLQDRYGVDDLSKIEDPAKRAEILDEWLGDAADRELNLATGRVLDAEKSVADAETDLMGVLEMMDTYRRYAKQARTKAAEAALRDTEAAMAQRRAEAKRLKAEREQLFSMARASRQKTLDRQLTEGPAQGTRRRSPPAEAQPVGPISRQGLAEWNEGRPKGERFFELGDSNPRDIVMGAKVPGGGSARLGRRGDHFELTIERPGAAEEVRRVSSLDEAMDLIHGRQPGGKVEQALTTPEPGRTPDFAAAQARAQQIDKQLADLEQLTAQLDARRQTLAERLENYRTNKEFLEARIKDLREQAQARGKTVSEAKKAYRQAQKEARRADRAAARSLGEVVDDIVRQMQDQRKNPMGVLDRDLLEFTPGVSGRTLERIIRLSPAERAEFVSEGFLENNLMTILSRHLEDTSARVALRETFGQGQRTPAQLMKDVAAARARVEALVKERLARAEEAGSPVAEADVPAIRQAITREVFKDLDATGHNYLGAEFARIEAAYRGEADRRATAMRAAGRSEEEIGQMRAALLEEHKAWRQDMLELERRLFGRQKPPPDWPDWLLWGMHMMRKVTYNAYGAGFLWASLTELVTGALTYGFRNFLPGNVRKWNALAKSAKENGASRDLRALMYGMENMAAFSRSARMLNADDVSLYMGFGSPGSTANKASAGIQRGVQAMADRLNFYSAQSWFNTRLKTMGGFAQLNNMVHDFRNWATLAQDRKVFYRGLGIDDGLAESIAGFTRKYGVEVDEGVIDPQAALWTQEVGGAEAYRALRVALRRTADRAIMTPGIGDTPLLMDHAVFRLLLQLQTFNFTVANKWLRGAQQRAVLFKDMEAMMSMTLAVGMGAVIVAIKDLFSGRDGSERSLNDWVYESVDRSGIMTHWSPYVDAALKVTGGPINELVGANVMPGGSSRFARNNAIQSLMGPWTRIAQAPLSGTASAIEGDFGRAFDEFFRLIPMNQYGRLAWNLSPLAED